MWPTNEGEYYAPRSFCGSFCNIISSCLSLLCCCWLLRDCCGGGGRGRPEPATPLLAPPSGPMDTHLGDLGGPHSPFGVPNPPGLPGQSRPPFQHGSLVRPGPPDPYGLSVPPEPPRFPNVL